MRFTGNTRKGKVTGIFLPAKSRDAGEDDYLVTEEVNSLQLDLQGIKGDRHYGFSHIADGRTTNLYSKGEVMRNNRQWTAISPDDLGVIARNLNINGLESEAIGINLLIDIQNLSTVPRGFYLLFGEEPTMEEGGVVLVVHGKILPCVIAGRAVASVLKVPRLEKQFPKASINFRGISGWVERGGEIKKGDTCWIMEPTGAD